MIFLLFATKIQTTAKTPHAQNLFCILFFFSTLNSKETAKIDENFVQIFFENNFIRDPNRMKYEVHKMSKKLEIHFGKSISCVVGII